MVDEKLRQEVADAIDSASKATGIVVGTPFNVPVVAIGLATIYVDQSIRYGIGYAGWSFGLLEGVWNNLPLIKEAEEKQKEQRKRDAEERKKEAERDAKQHAKFVREGKEIRPGNHFRTGDRVRIARGVCEDEGSFKDQFQGKVARIVGKRSSGYDMVVDGESVSHDSDDTGLTLVSRKRKKKKGD
jgi:ribosomal protein L21E